MPLSFGVAKAFRSGEFRDPAIVFGDFFVFNFEWNTGKDLDIRASIINPAVDGVLGWARDNTLVANGQTIAYWSGDNPGTSGRESFYLDRSKYFLAFPSANSIEFDLRCFWNEILGTNVIIKMDAYQGGVMVNDGNYGFRNPTSIITFPASRSESRAITLKTSSSSTQGQRHSRAVIDFIDSKLTYFST
jgi:hypothetical protein